MARCARRASQLRVIVTRPRSQAGPLVLRVAATDLAGNGDATQVTVHVRAAPKKKKSV